MPFILLKLKHTAAWRVIESLLLCYTHALLAHLLATTYRLFSLLRRSLECLRNLRLPAQPVLPKDFRRNGEFLRALQQTGSYDDLIAEDGLVVVYVGGAVGTVVAVDGVAWGRGLLV